MSGRVENNENQRRSGDGKAYCCHCCPACLMGASTPVDRTRGACCCSSCLARPARPETDVDGTAAAEGEKDEEEDAADEAEGAG